MSLTSFILKFAVPFPDILKYDNYLFIGPHPDDIEIGAGATIAKLTSLGKRVSFLICLDGRFGLDFAPEGTTPSELIEIRKAECIEAAKELDVTDVHFLGLSDGGLYAKEDLLSAMAVAIGKIQPDIIFAPDPDVSSECHMDHLNVGNCAKNLAFFAPFKEIMATHGAESANVQAIGFYMTAKPNRYVRTGKYLKMQLSSILCHKSQFPVDSEAFSSVKTYLTLRSIDFGIRSFKGRAEGFRVLSRTHMHCLPEAGK